MAGRKVARRHRGLHLGAIAMVVPLLAAAVAIPAAQAEGDKSNPWAGSDADDGTAYQKAIRAGVAEYDAGHFEEARVLFRKAHEVRPNARTLRGVGMASFELRDYVAAVRNLTAALRDGRKPLSSEQRKDVQDLLDRSRAFVDTFTLKVVPPTARLTVDGRPAEIEPDGTVLLGFGAHWLEVKAPAMVPLSQSVDVRGGARRQLLLALEPAPDRRASSLAPTTTAGETTGSLAPKPSHGRAAAWLWASAGAALLSSGAGFYWYRQSAELHDCRTPGAGLRCTDEDTLVTQRNAGIAATLVTGAAAVTMALVGILTWNSRAARDKARPLACSTSLVGITCGSSF